MRSILSRVRRLAVVACSSALLATTFVSAAVPPASAEASIQAQLAQVRAATAAYHSIPTAEARGYIEFLPCFDDPVQGGMGQHWLLPTALAQPLDPTTPTALVYEPRDGSYQLVAVEYVVPGPSDMTPPRLLGRNFTYLAALGVWKLHAWIWRPNPSGMFADYNPNSAMCP
jgi:hypothetical protein